MRTAVPIAITAGQEVEQASSAKRTLWWPFQAGPTQAILEEAADEVGRRLAKFVVHVVHDLHAGQELRSDITQSPDGVVVAASLRDPPRDDLVDLH